MKPFVYIQLVIFLLLLGNGAHLLATNTAPVVNAPRDNTQTQRSDESTLALSGQNWQIKPGENIFQIAQLVYPSNAIARDSLVRAIIKSNPQLFPNSVYQPIPVGTVIYLPDLRDIGSYAKPVHKKQNKAVSKNSSDTDNPVTKLQNNDRFVQRISHLEQGAENSTHDLNKLNQHIDTLFAQIATLQLAAQTIKVNPKIEFGAVDATDTNNTTDTASVSSIVESSNSTVATTPATSFETSIPPTIPENLVDTRPIVESETESSLMTSLFDNDFLLLAGLLLALLLVILLLRRFRNTKNKHPRHEYDVADIQPIERHGLGGFFRKKTESNDLQHAEHSITQSTDMALLAREMIQRGESRYAAIQFLQKQLAVDRLDVHGWLHLFELLYQSGNKTDFKKNARRFKRLNEFPDIWAQIQALGNRLEPNEPLYFDDQKRQEKFFSDTPSSSLE